MGSSKKLRLPENILILVGGAAVLFGLIAFGVGWSQIPNEGSWRSVDWTWFKGCCGVLAACVALRFCGLFDWIEEDELERMEKAERDAEYRKELADGTFTEHSRRTETIVIVGSALAYMMQFLGDRAMNFHSPLRDGGEGGTLFGMTFGVFHAFGRTFTGFEIVFVGILLAALALLLRKGFARLARANRREP